MAEGDADDDGLDAQCLLPRLASNFVFFFVLFPTKTLDWRVSVLFAFLKAPEENGDAFSSTFPWEIEPPVGTLHVKGKPHCPARGADRVRGPACAKGAAAYQPRRWNSATARSRNAGGRSAAGRRHGGRPNIAKRLTPKPGTPRRSASTVSGSRLRPRPFNSRGYVGVVTQQKLFSPSLVRSAGLL